MNSYSKSCILLINYILKQIYKYLSILLTIIGRSKQPIGSDACPDTQETLAKTYQYAFK